jgi:hypothetical protein
MNTPVYDNNDFKYGVVLDIHLYTIQYPALTTFSIVSDRFDFTEDIAMLLQDWCPK